MVRNYKYEDQNYPANIPTWRYPNRWPFVTLKGQG